MAKRKPAARAAVKKAAQKKTPARKSAVGKSAVGKSAVGKSAVGKSAVAKTTARKKLKAKARVAPLKARRPKQRIAVSHHRDEDFKTDGLRTYARYRDLGIADATAGLARAHVIRLIGPCNPDEVAKLHYHDVEFQMVYVLKGWVKSYLEGVGETLMKEGSSWTQPPRIRHMILDHSDDVELLEVILPADFKTVELTA
jgi:mannose-6-phosphate isomerase-like protein (cupin superfamily)